MPNDDLDAYLDPLPKRRNDYDEIITRHSQRVGLDPDLVRAVVHQESRGNRRAVSPKGAQGLGQLMPGTAKRFNVKDPFDPEENVRGATDYLKFLNDRYQGNRDLILAGYNAGEGAVDKFKGIPPYRETQNYVKSINARLNQRQSKSDLDAYLDPVEAVTEKPVAPARRRTPPQRRSVPAQPVSFWDRVRGRMDESLKPPARPLNADEAWDRFTKAVDSPVSPQRTPRERVRAEVEKEYRGRRGPYASPTVSGILHTIANPVDSLTGLFRSDEENINRETEARLKQQAIAAEPEVESIRKEYGAMSAPVRSVAAPVIGRGGGGMLKVAGGVASLFGIAPNRLSEWANRRGEIIQAGANLPPLQGEREVERGVPEKVTTGLADLGVAVGEIILLRRVTKLPFNQLLALEAAARNSDKPLSEQATRTAEAYALGTALDRHMSRPVSAAISGIPAGAQTGYEVSQGRMSPLDAAIQTGIQTASGAVLTSPKPKERPSLRPVAETPAERRIARIEETEAERAAIREQLQEVESQSNPRARAIDTELAQIREQLKQAPRNAPVSELDRRYWDLVAEREGLSERGRSLEDYLDEPQSKVQPPVEAQRAEAESGPATAGVGPRGVDVQRRPAVVASESRAADTAIPEVAAEPARFYHRDFGEVTEAPNQKKTGRGKVKILDAEGRTHYVKRSDLTGRGNQRMVPLKPEPERRSPERMRETDWLELTPEEQARMRNELDLSQKYPVEPKPAQVDILSEPDAGARIVQKNRDLLTSRAFRERLLTESVGGNAGEGRAAVNAAVDNDGRIVELGNIQNLTADTQNLMRTGKLRNVTFIVKDALTENPQIERVRIEKPVDPTAPPRHLSGGWYVDFEDPARSYGVPPEIALTSARKSRLAEDRAALDLPELPPAERKSWQKSLSEAKPEQATRLADEVLNRPRGLSDSETASLVVRAQQVKNEHAAKLKEINKADEADLPQLRSELETIEREFDLLSTAAKQSGTEKARALAAQKLTINQDFDLVSMVGRFRSAAGRKETAAERATIEAQSKRIAELETQISEANDRLAQQRLQKELDKEAARERRRTGRAQSRQALDEEFTDLRAQFARARAEIKNVQASGLAGLDPEGKLTKLIGQMARNRIRAGVTDAAQLVDDVHAAIAEYLPEVSKRDIRDAISGYGVTSKPNAEPVAQRLREIKQLLRDMSALEDIEEGQPPLRSGYQRDKPSQEVRESRRRVQEELRRHPEIEQAMRDPAEQQKSLLDAAKTRLRNRIEDLNRLVIEGRRESKTPARVTPDGELQQLRQERDRLQGLYDQIPDPGANARAIQRSLATIEKSVAELERKIQENDLSARPRDVGLTSPELETARARRSDLQRELSKLRRVEKRGSLEQQRARRVEAELRQTDRDIADLQRRVSTGDVGQARERPQSLWTRELGRAKQERAALQKQVREMRAATPEAKRREAQRKLEAAERSIAELQRKIQQGDTSTRSRPSPETPELASARREQKALRSILNDLRLASKPKLSEAEAQARKQLATERAVQTRMKKQMVDLEQQMSSGQFREKAEREPPRYTRETYRLQKELEAIKAEYERLKYRATATTGQKIKDTALGLGNAPKTLLSMGDFSALLRQGGYNFVTHPILSSRAAVDMVRSMSERGFANVEAEIKNHDLFDESVRNGIEYTGIDRLDPRLSKREEGYLGSGFIDAISKGKYNPLGYTLKPLKDVSERTFVSFLDSQRIRVYAQQANAIRSMKLTPEQTKAALKAQAAFINAATGRGNLGARGNAAAPLLNMAMFSPRLLASRLTLLNKMFNPVAWKNLPPGARKQIMVDNVKFLGFTALTLGLAKAAGLGVSLDPDDSEFLKIKAGNTRYDTLVGLQQPMRLFLRMVGYGGNQFGGAIRGGETYSGEPAGDILLDFVRSKASPEAGYVWDALEGKNRMTGKKFEAGRDAARLAVPLPFQDFQKAIETDGAVRGFVETLPALIGVGAQTYQGAAEKPTTHAEKLARRYTREKMPDEARTQQEIDIDAKRSQLRARARKGEDVSGDITTLGAQITERQAKSILNARNQSRLREDFNRLGPKEAIIVYGVASPAQKAELRELLQKKSALIDLMPPAEQEEVRKRFEAAGMTRSPLPREPRERREKTERKPREKQGYVFQ